MPFPASNCWQAWPFFGADLEVRLYLYQEGSEEYAKDPGGYLRYEPQAGSLVAQLQPLEPCVIPQMAFDLLSNIFICELLEVYLPRANLECVGEFEARSAGGTDLDGG